MTKCSIPAAVLKQHLAVLGKTGSGKTSTEKLAVEQVVADGFRVCVLDPTKSDWWGITSSASGKRAGLPFKILGGPRGHVPLHSSAGKAIGHLVGSGNLPLSIIDMADFEVGGVQKFFIDFAPALMRSAKGVLYLVIEEAHELAPKERAGFNAENMAMHYAKKLATAGRSKGIRLIVATQRVQALHNAVLGSCETVIAHRLTTPADQEPVVKWLRSNSDKATADKVAASLSSLQTGTGWICSGEARIFELVNFPKFSTYDNTATPEGDDAAHDVATAAVDQDELRAIIGDAVKEAEANDPKALRSQLAEKNQEISRLQAALSSGEKVKAHQKVTKEAIAEAEKRGFEQARKKLTASIEKAARTKMIEELGILRETFAPMAGALDAAIKAAKHAEIDASKVQFTPAQPAKAFPPERASLPQKVPSQVKRLTPSGNGADRGPIDRPLQLIINAIRWWNVMGIDTPKHAQVAFVAGYSHKSGTWGTYLSRLRSLGLIEGRGDLMLTPEGADVVQDPDTPPTDEQLRAAVLEKLDEPLVKILAPIIAAYPKGLSHQDAGEQAGYSSSSGTWGTYLSRLRSLDLIEGRGELKAQDWLFPLKMAA